jgi:glutamyl-tRNA reductase
MQIIVAGLNHKTASVDIRERLAFGAKEAVDALDLLKKKFPESEFVLLSTCNRVELYCAAKPQEELSADELVNFLSENRKVNVDDFKEHLYILNNEKAVRHLLTVTTSLDSMVVGESQINAQVKESFRLSNKAKSSGKVLSKLFHCAFSTSKDIYTNTSICSRRVSVAGVTVELACQLFENIKSASVKVIGAGEMGDLLVEHFLHIKNNDITIINRSKHRGQDVAKKHGVSFDNWENLNDHLLNANIIIGAVTTEQGYLFDKDALVKIMNERKGKTLLIVDIAVPRSFDPTINDIENVYLYCVDDLSQVIEENIKLREDDIEQAVRIICEKTGEFMDWFETKDIGPLIGQIKNNFDMIRQAEMDKFFVGTRDDACCKEAMEQSMGKVVNKLLHCVIKNINNTAKEHGIESAKRVARSIAKHAEEIIEEDIENGEQ